MFTLLQVGGALLAVYILKRVYIFVKAQRDSDRHVLHLVTTIQPVTRVGALFPRSLFHRGLRCLWDERYTLYKDADMKTIAIIPLFHGGDILFTSSLSAFHQCLATGAPFKKPETGVLNFMGENVLTTEGDAWRRHRRIAGPAFNHSTYRNVWETTARVYADMLRHEGWLHVDETAPAEFNKITHKLALFLISSVGFNIPMSWHEPHRDKEGRLSVQAMIFEVANSMWFRSQLPRWLFRIGVERIRRIEEAYTTFERFMHERISEREAQLKKVRAMEGTNDTEVAENIKDIFGLLVNARLSDGKLSLSEEEIIGNCLIFTFAGHETTANTLVIALALLALYPDKQEWVYNSIKSAIGDRVPTFDDYDALDGVLACFYEALRMYPAAYMMFRMAIKDTTLSIPRRSNPDVVEQVFVKKDTPICLDMVGLLYDPETFPEPHAFKPERWVSSRKQESSGTSITKDVEAGEVSSSSPAASLEGFMGFSFGPRTCIGHKFAKVESVAFLTLLLREWRVEPVMRKGESKEMWKERVLKPSLLMSLTVKDVPLRLIRRK